MKYRFPLKDVKIEVATQKREVKSPLFNDGFYILNQNEFSMDVEGVGWFYASGGNFVSILPYPRADQNTIELYLNGSVYGAILHQRKILTLHGSSFIWESQGIILCGESGAGKSSLTAAFYMNGAEFLTDDITSIVFKNDLPYIHACSDRIKLWDHTLKQLELDKNGLVKIDPDTEKYYYPLTSVNDIVLPLNMLFVIEVHKKPEIEIKELKGADKFTALRNEIYRWEYLQAMPETESWYLEKLLSICRSTVLIKVLRPFTIPIKDFSKTLQTIIKDNPSIQISE